MRSERSAGEILGPSRATPCPWTCSRSGPGSRRGGPFASSLEPGSPWENPFIESFNGRYRDELLNVEEFGSLLEAQVVVEVWRMEYNTYRPHSSLRGLAPAEYRARWVPEDENPRTPDPSPLLAGALRPS